EVAQHRRYRVLASENSADDVAQGDRTEVRTADRTHLPRGLLLQVDGKVELTAEDLREERGAGFDRDRHPVPSRRVDGLERKPQAFQFELALDDRPGLHRADGQSEAGDLSCGVVEGQEEAVQPHLREDVGQQARNVATKTPAAREFFDEGFDGTPAG